MEERAKPLVLKLRPSLVNFNNEFIFVIGGISIYDQSCLYVEKYDIKNDSWSKAPELN